MNAKKVIANNDLELFVKEIYVLENPDDPKSVTLTFFADGYPGIVYAQSESMLLLPRGKELAAFFLYGQMIAPYELSVRTPYVMIVFQLYPFAAQLLFDINPKRLNDDCADLSRTKGAATGKLLNALATTSTVSRQIDIIAGFIAVLARKKGLEEYREIQQAIQMIQDHKGILPINELARCLNTTERTLRRKFSRYVGISPKKFAKIIQFQNSFDQITTGDFSKLTDVVYDNGYADQSHFIRNIRKFTGKKPLQLKTPQ